MYKVADARAKLADAQDAYDSGDLTLASTLAEQAAGLAKPPIEIYGAVIGIIVIAIGGIIWYRRKDSASF